MIKLKGLRLLLFEYTRNKNITIKRKKKMVIEQDANGDTKLKRKNVIKIEIIE